MKSRTKRSGCRIFSSFAMILLFLIVVAAAGSAFFYRALTTPYKGYEDQTIRFEVKKGAGTASIMKRLQRSGILRDDFFPTIYLKTLRRGASLKAGVYEFKGQLSPIAVLNKIISGEVILRSVTLREGLDRFAVAAVMADAGFGTVDEWVKVTADPEMIRDVDPDAESLEGYLFPDTYLLTPGTAPRAVVKLMLDNFRKQFGDELAYITNDLSVHETITLASVVETEAQKQEERPIVASVYLNRHRRSMPLQADPTVIYAMKLAGKWNGNIRRADLKIDSPYNTYVRRGFPPGPIANPGLASLRAAAAPATTNFLYFVSRNDGSHVFATNLAEHNRNVQEFQRTYWRKLRQAQQPAAK